MKIKAYQYKIKTSLALGELWSIELVIWDKMWATRGLVGLCKNFPSRPIPAVPSRPVAFRDGKICPENFRDGTKLASGRDGTRDEVAPILSRPEYINIKKKFYSATTRSLPEKSHAFIYASMKIPIFLPLISSFHL